MRISQKLVITILTFTIFISISTAFAQVAPMLDLPHAFFKSDHEVYPIQYNITNGRLEGNVLDLSSRALIFVFNSTEDGQLAVELPRSIIDSTRDGRDKPYFVALGSTGNGLKRIHAKEILNNNETRILEINFLKGLWEVEIAGTYFVETNTPRTTINLYSGWSPLAQWQHGIDPQDVICKEGLMLVTKKTDNSPACIKPITYNKLVEREWVSIQGTQTIFYVFANDTKYEIPYHVEGWKNKVLNMTADIRSNTIMIELQAKNDGELTLTIPNVLLNVNALPNEDIFVLINGEESKVKKDERNGASRTVTIDFPRGAELIEIIGTNLI